MIRMNPMHDTKNPPGTWPPRTLGDIIDRVQKQEAFRHTVEQIGKYRDPDTKDCMLGITYIPGITCHSWWTVDKALAEFRKLIDDPQVTDLVLNWSAPESVTEQ